MALRRFGHESWLDELARLSALRRAFNLAAQANRIVRCPHVPLLHEDNVRTGFFERDQYAALRAALPDYLRPAIDFAYETGWRIREVLTLTWAQVDSVAGTVRLEPGRGRTKTGEGRVFPFDVLPVLGELLRRQREATTAVERAQERIIPFVFHRDGRLILSYMSAWKRACKAAGLVGKIAHDFRRTAARNMEHARVPRSVAMKLLGHKTESMYRRYTIASEADLRDGVAKLAALHTAQANAPRTFVSMAAVAGRRRGEVGEL